MLSRRTVIAALPTSAAHPAFASNQAKMTVMFVYHSISTDNEAHIATGWNDGALSPLGRKKAEQLRPTITAFGPQIAYCSDLGRAAETADLTLRDTGIPVLFTRALRECNFGKLNGSPAVSVHADDLIYLDQPYSDGESYAEAFTRTAHFIRQTILVRSEKRALIIGHGVTRWAVAALATGDPLKLIMTAHESFRFPDDWNNAGKGWVYEIRRP